jgi:hypothetical protein
MRFRVLIAGSLAALISCRSGTEPTFLDPLTIALQQVSWAEFNNYQHHISDFGLPPVFPISTYDPRVCAYTAQDGAFTCSTQGENAFGWTVRYFLYDGAGAAQSAFDERTTDRVRVVVDADGRIPGPSVGGQVPNLTYDRVIHHHSDFTLSGMLGAERSVSERSAVCAYDRRSLNGISARSRSVSPTTLQRTVSVRVLDDTDPADDADSSVSIGEICAGPWRGAPRDDAAHGRISSLRGGPVSSQ